MPIEMISPRTVYNRRPLGRYVVDTKCNIEDDDLSVGGHNNEFWIVRTLSNKQTELYVRGRHAVLHNFTALDKNHLFTGFTEKPIVCATFACLSHRESNNASMISIFEEKNESLPTGVMLFTKDIGKYYSFNAEIESCKLPCAIGRAWTFRNCLLVERLRRSGNQSHYTTSLFAMTHCLAEFTPVVFVDDLGHNGFVSDTNVRIGAVCEKSMLLLGYNERLETFMLWCVRDAVRCDFEDLYESNADGSVTAKIDTGQSLYTNVIDNSCKTMETHEDCHSSVEYFEDSSRPIIGSYKKNIDDLDLRSPLARSLKNISEEDLSVKSLSLQNNSKNQIRITNRQDKFSEEPLFPKVCLQQLHTFKPLQTNALFNPNDLTLHSTPVNGGKSTKTSSSSNQVRREPSGFFAEDFYNRKYVCCMQSVGVRTCLQIVKFNYDGRTFTSFEEKRFMILDALYLQKLKLIVVLEENKTISLYTGMDFICKISLLHAMVHEPNLFEDSCTELSTEDINDLVLLSEPTDYGFTLQTKTGLSLRLYLPEMVRFHLVQKCLITLKKLLPINVGTTLLCRWYSLNRAVDNNESTSVEWPRFVDFLLENLGFRKSGQQGSLATVTDLNFNNTESKDTDVSMQEVSAKKSRTNFGIYSFEDRTKSRDRLDEFSSLALNVSDKLLTGFAITVLYSLHLVYETEKLNFSSCLYLENLAALNCSLAYATESCLYVEYYVTDYPDLWPRLNKLPSIRQFAGQSGIWDQQPPDWSRWFSAVMSGLASDACRYPIIEDLNEMTMNLMHLFLVMFRHRDLVANVAVEVNRHTCRIKFNGSGEPTRYDFSVTDDSVRVLGGTVLSLPQHFQRAAAYLSEIGFHSTDLDYMNPGLAAVVRVICAQCTNCPPDCCNANLYALLDRTDMEKQRSLILPIIDENRVREVISTPPNDFRRLSEVRQNCYSYWSNNVQFARGIPCTVRRNRAVDNCYLLSVLQDDPIIRLAFPDIRVGEAYKMLQSCSPVQLDVSICTHFTRDEGDTPSEALKEELDSHLKTITSQRTFALAFGRGMLGLQVLNSNSLTDTLHVPLLCVSGKYLLSDSGKPHTVENTTSIKPWPSFHNGVAAGLMISPMNHLVDYVWILKQCPSNQLDLIELSPEKAGVLFGLALNGHLNKLSSATIGNTIKSMNEMATMAVLIGLSAHNLGSKNLVLSKHISFHYRPLIPEEKDHNEQIPCHSQVSAIISAGLLNFKSGDRKMARIFIDEMGRSREYLTSDKSSLLDIELTSVTAGFSVGLIMFQQGDTFNREYNSEELIRLMNYLKGGYRFPGKENMSPDAPSDNHIRTLIKNVETKRPQPISQPDTWNSFQATNPRVLEGEYYNTDITGPGAAVALGMIFMGSSNVVVAQQLQCPETFILLEEVRSPLLCFRQIAWGMVMWHEIRPTRVWIEKSIPEFVSSNALLRSPKCISEKYWDTVNESYLQLLVGSCFVLALRYAGTDNKDARDTIIHYIERLLEVKRDTTLMETLNRCQYDWALSCIFLAACIVTAGTGNLQLLKIVRALRSVHHPKEFANYGVNTAYSMAIGLLFLGGGKLTLSNSPRCAAILLISFFPRFPPTYSGKRYHLQALRHLYVIATRPRVMCAVDIDTQIAVSISSRVVLKHETRDYQGCFVYPADDPSSIKQIEFYHKGGQYYPQKYKPGTESWRILLESLLTGGYFFVKKKSSEQSLQSILGKFSPEKVLPRALQLRDFELLVDFLDSTNCSQMSGLSQQKIVYYFMDNKSRGIKDVVSRAACLQSGHFLDMCSFFDWCQQRGLLKMLSMFLVYMKVSLGSLGRLAQGHDYRHLMSEEAWFLMDQILQ